MTRGRRLLTTSLSLFLISALYHRTSVQAVPTSTSSAGAGTNSDVAPDPLSGSVLSVSDVISDPSSSPVASNAVNSALSTLSLEHPSPQLAAVLKSEGFSSGMVTDSSPTVYVIPPVNIPQLQQQILQQQQQQQQQQQVATSGTSASHYAAAQTQQDPTTPVKRDLSEASGPVPSSSSSTGSSTASTTQGSSSVLCYHDATTQGLMHCSDGASYQSIGITLPLSSSPTAPPKRRAYVSSGTGISGGSSTTTPGGVMRAASQVDQPGQAGMIRGQHPQHPQQQQQQQRQQRKRDTMPAMEHYGGYSLSTDAPDFGANAAAFGTGSEFATAFGPGDSNSGQSLGPLEAASSSFAPLSQFSTFDKYCGNGGRGDSHGSSYGNSYGGGPGGWSKFDNSFGLNDRGVLKYTSSGGESENDLGVMKYSGGSHGYYSGSGSSYDHGYSGSGSSGGKSSSKGRRQLGYPDLEDSQNKYYGGYGGGSDCHGSEGNSHGSGYGQGYGSSYKSKRDVAPPGDRVRSGKAPPTVIPVPIEIDMLVQPDGTATLLPPADDDRSEPYH
ncbi:hypothetical protein BGZ99_002762 [Dissophora globulifera]|uniref:Uncharacterized protein n=1 Tax=Dissophora globulifera TaxID=979702 RepID=A0A9P6UX19_9FUNG|nr:hypothetical protein BGZ99_002762 [Dissophora globulifera]